MEKIPQDVIRFRKEWILKVPRAYSAKIHYLGTSAVSFPLVGFGLMKLGSFSLFDYLMIPIFFLIASGVEYLAHRFPLHRKIPFMEKAYQEHTLRHHHYFTDQSIEARLFKDYYRVLFPVWGVVLIQYGVNVPVSWFVGSVFSENAGYLGLVIGVLFFFLYETIHAICHFPEESVVFRMPGIWFLREHHRIHHAKSVMSQANFNIVLPIWDWILGTRRSVLRR